MGLVGDANISCDIPARLTQLKRGWWIAVQSRFRYCIILAIKCDVVRKVTLQPPTTRHSGGL